MSDKLRGRMAANSNDIIARQIAQRKAVAEANSRAQRVFVTRSRFGPMGLEARVLVDGQRYFDVNQRKLDRLREGWTPEELMIDEVDVNE
jgi:hypothetical protein